jgi:hypothetical protein
MLKIKSFMTERVLMNNGRLVKTIPVPFRDTVDDRLEFIELYKKFKSLNPKEALVQRAKEVIGVTNNVLEAGFVMEDGTLLKLRKGHYCMEKSIKGFDDYMDSREKSFTLFNFFMWHTGAIRILVKSGDLFVQVCAEQDISEAQWGKLDFIISLFGNTMLHFDIIAELKDSTRNYNKYLSEAKKVRNSYSLRLAYERARIGLKSKSL